ncbi:MAG: hypothetical protein C0497_12495 [Gemmatimonas sp.]|nr:hypothetical protein [Gemmatimonas sp.]
MLFRFAARAIAPLLILPSVAFAQADTSLTAPGAKLERVFCCGVFLEGPAAAPDGSIYFTDITATYNSSNDLVADHQGRIFFSDPRYIGDEPIDQPVLGVYRIDTDIHGNIWGAQLAWRAVVAYSPDGKELGRIPIEEGATNVEFGRGAEADVLYITGRTGLYRVQVKTRGWHAGER